MARWRWILLVLTAAALSQQGVAAGPNPAGGAKPAARPPAAPSPMPAEAAAALVRGLSDPDPRVREAAATALRALRPPAAVPFLLPLLKDEDPNRRRMVIEVLAQTASPEGVRALIRAADATKGDLRREIASALAVSPGAAEGERTAFFLRLSRESEPRLRYLAMAGLANR